MSSADRRPSRQELAKRKAAELRGERGVDAKSTVQTALTAKTLLKVFKPSTERSLKAELGRFETFVNEHLLTEEAGKTLWRDWAGGRSFDELMESDDGSAPPLTTGIMHAFARWRAAGMRGRIQERPAVDSVQQVVDLLWTAYSRKTHTTAKQDRTVLTSAHAYCSTTLKDELNLHQEQKARRVPDREVLMDVVAALFSPDLVNEFTVFRLYTLLVINLQVASASRVGAILRSTQYSDAEYATRALQWRHCEVWIHHPDQKRDRYNLVQIQFKLEYTKTSTGKGRKYDMYDADLPAFFGASMLLALGVADGVFVGDPQLAWLLDPEVLEGKESRILPIKESWLNEPLFRQSAPTPRDRQDDGHSGYMTDYQALGQAWRANKYDAVLADACQKAGYPSNFASHDLRVLAVTAALNNSDHRLEEIQYAIGHSIISDKWTKYLNNTATINFQAAILGEGTTYEKLRKLSYMRSEKDPNLPTYLSRESKQARFDDDELSAIVLNQREVRRKLRDKSNLSPEEILSLEHQARDLYLDYKAKEAVVYKKVMKAEVVAHLAKTKILPNEREKILARVDEVDVNDQVDALPDGALVDHNLDLTTAVIASTDFSAPDSIVRLLSAVSSLEDTFQLFQSAVSATSADKTATTTEVEPASTRASTSAAPSSSSTRTPFKATSSQLLMPPPSVPARAQEKIATPPPPSVTTPPAATSIEAIQPRVRAKKAAESKVALAAENRFRSASVSSATSATSSSASTSAMSAIDSTYKDSVSYRLDQVATMLLDPSVDRLEFVEAILKLPAKCSHATGWWPGLTSKVVAGEHQCPRCSITLTELVKGMKLLRPAAKLSKLKQHIFNCTQEHIKEAAMPSLIASFQQAQACPICMAHIDNVEDETEFLEGVRTPKQWADHLRHTHSEGDFCICGYNIGWPSKDGQLHLAVEHNIWSSKLGSATVPIGPTHFPLPHLSLRDYHFYPDPREWESHQQQEYELVINGAHVLPAEHAWAVRSDLTVSQNDQRRLNTVIAEIDAVSPRLGLLSVEDGRFEPVILDANAKIVSKYGYCIICAGNTEETFTERMATYNHLSNQRKHFMTHVINMITGREVLKHVSHQWRDPNAMDEDIEESDPGPTSWRNLRFRCPDQLCRYASSSLSLRQLVNHIYLHHRAFNHGTLGGACYATTDDEFIVNLRSHFSNLSLKVLATKAGFPLEELQGLEMLVGKKKRGARSQSSPPQTDEDEDGSSNETPIPAKRKYKPRSKGVGRYGRRLPGVGPVRLPKKQRKTAKEREEDIEDTEDDEPSSQIEPGRCQRTPTPETEPKINRLRSSKTKQVASGSIIQTTDIPRETSLDISKESNHDPHDEALVNPPSPPQHLPPISEKKRGKMRATD